MLDQMEFTTRLMLQSQEIRLVGTARTPQDPSKDRVVTVRDAVSQQT